ncbi:WXG100 family type VII secretion target [Kitasatospora phosalacinea]|uniref:WXG100 family type VII secretion target n=1 Tax=Kitasatospora phosalacinea TaxID=2065 RepID=UPI000527545D|nr:hypothetical protein [Kitasatospora phosalacinea]
MSNDEQASYVEADARIEPDRVVHRVPVTPAEPEHFLIGTAVPEQIAAEPVQPDYAPLRPMERGVPLSEHGLLAPDHVATEPVQPDYAPLRPMERGRPVQQATPAQRNSRPAAARNAGSGSGSSGGAGSGFRVDPEQYRAAVSPMLAASEQVADIYRSLSAYLPSLEAQNPWGNDESGKKFAEGDQGYLKISHSTMTLLKSLPGGLKGIAEGLKQMAESYQNVDENTIAELGGIESTAQLPEAPSLPSAPVHLPITPGMTQSGRH